MSAKRARAVVVLVVVTLVGAGPALAASPTPALTTTPTATPVSTPTPTPRPLTTGTIGAHGTYGLGFGRAAALVPPGATSSGANATGQWLVTKVSVEIGDRVARGDVLAEADDTTARLQLDTAQAAVDLAQAKLDRDLARPTADDTAKAEAALKQAQQKLDAANQSLADTRNQSETVIKSAKQTLWLAQNLLKRDTRSGQPASTIASDRRAVLAARVALQNAIPTAAANDNRAQQAVDAAVIGLEAAQQAYATAIAPGTPDVIASDRLALAQARQALATAQTAVNGTRVVAPVDGVVSALTLVPGLAASGADTVQLQEGPMEAIIHVSQLDVASLTVGQSIAVTVVALGQQLTGHVTQVGLSPSSAANAAVVTYPVSVALDDPPDMLRPGMTVVFDPSGA